MPRPLAFPRSARLVRASDFERVYREGARARGAILALVVRPNGTAQTRLGLSVGRSIWRSAVERNRVRRIFREAFRLSLPELPPGIDVVMIPAVPKLRPELRATCAELLDLARRAEGKARRRAAAAPPVEKPA